MRRIAVFGCKSTTRFILEALLERGPVHALVTIAPDLAAKNDVADYEDLSAFAASRGIACHQAASYALKDAADVEAVRALGIDLAFVIGWQRLIPSDILSTFSVGAFGMHGSAEDLPRGRGRSPMNWSLIEGRDRFHTNLFRYDAGADSGEILDTLLFSIRPEDTAETMHFKNVLAMKRLILKNLDALLTGTFTLKPQAAVMPTYYPKREPGDSLIDWRNGIAEIERFIRAVAPPFSGAFSFIDGKRVFIDRAAVFETDDVFGLSDFTPGTIVEVFPNGKWLVRCADGLLLVHEWRGDAEIRRGAACISPPEAIRAFPRNKDGFHDIEPPSEDGKAS